MEKSNIQEERKVSKIEKIAMSAYGIVVGIPGMYAVSLVAAPTIARQCRELRKEKRETYKGLQTAFSIANGLAIATLAYCIGDQLITGHPGIFGDSETLYSFLKLNALFLAYEAGRIKFLDPFP